MIIEEENFCPFGHLSIYKSRFDLGQVVNNTTASICWNIELVVASNVAFNGHALSHERMGHTQTMLKSKGEGVNKMSTIQHRLM